MCLTSTFNVMMSPGMASTWYGDMATVVPGAADQNDLVITQSPTAFVKTFNNIQDPMELIQAGDIKPSNFDGMKTFGALFPPPDPDRVWEALPG